MRTRAKIEPSVLKWGRESSGLALADAARKQRVKPEDLEKWEEGKAAPTITQLRKAADVYKRPVNLFFLPRPPAETSYIPHDFRQLPGIDRGAVSPELLYQIRRAHERRAVALDLYRELDETPPTFAFQCALADEPEATGARLREALHVAMVEQRRWRQPYDALSGWRAKIEATGVLVCQMSGVDLKEARGLSIPEQPLPVIVGNSKDAPNGRVFTLLHELAHVALRRGGLCDAEDRADGRTEDDRIEIFCNAVAAATLLPLQELLSEQLVREHKGDWTSDKLETLARQFGVSKFVVLRRLLTAGRTTPNFYNRMHRMWTAALRESAKESGKVPPDRKAVSEAGKGFVRLVLRAYHAQSINLSDVSRFLGVRVKHVPAIENAVLG
jgi:Zn-dependent peptidase ImmA (M78 family)